MNSHHMFDFFKFFVVTEMDAELEKLMADMVERQKKDETKQQKEILATRVEYDSVVDGLSAINFHLTLFLLLCVMAALNIPTAITWAHNYSFGERVLQNDPSYFPAIASIISLSIIWQMPTPRNVYVLRRFVTQKSLTLFSFFLFVAAMATNQCRRCAI